MERCVFQECPELKTLACWVKSNSMELFASAVDLYCGANM